MISEKHPFAMTEGKTSSRRRRSLPLFGKRRDKSSKLDLESYVSSMHSTCSIKSCISTGSKEFQQPRRVSFDTIEIREFERALSDNPAVTSGPALGLSWNHCDTSKVDVDAFESVRKPFRSSSFQLDKEKRESLLLESGVSAMEMKLASKQAYLIKCRRRATISVAPSVEKRHELMEAASRKVKRLLSLQNKAKEVDKLWKDARGYVIQNTPRVQAPEEASLQSCVSCNDLEKDLVPSKVTTQYCGDLLDKMSLSDDECDEHLIPPLILVHNEPIMKEEEEEEEEEEDSEWGFEVDEITGEDTSEN